MFGFIDCKDGDKCCEYKGQFDYQCGDYLLFCGGKVGYFKNVWCIVYNDVYVGELLYCLQQYIEEYGVVNIVVSFK